MADTPKDKPTEMPAPEVLKPQGESEPEASPEKGSASTPAGPKPPKRPRRGTYRPSHKATFIGLVVVIVILAINAAVIAFVIKAQSKAKEQADQGQVTVSQAALENLGVNNTPVGDKGIELTVNPNARFNGDLQVGGNISVAGQLLLNNNFSADSASLTQLKAGNVSLQQLNVNGDGTITNMNVRNSLVVAGISRLQGPVTLSQLLTVPGINVTGNLAVGGELTVNGFHTSSLTSDSTLTIGGHVITRGSAPGLSRGSGLGGLDTVSISGNDASGTIAVNIGAGGLSCGGGCTLANVTFTSAYGNIPHVVVSAVGPVVGGSVYVFRSASGFSLGITGSLSTGGHAFDYIVEQ